MNKILHINVGKYPFTIDTDAYAILDDYLDKLNKHFSSSDGCEEIMQDIESRIAEIFLMKMAYTKIIDMETVKYAISKLGTPEEFGAADQSKSSTHSSYQKTNANWGIKPGRKLFRDPMDKKVAGVCSGLAAYFGIEDPLWIRVAFAIGLFAGGIAVPLYFILMIVAPVAKTSADRLQMAGEPINIDTIAKKVEEGFNKVTDKIDSWQKSK